MVRRAPLRLLLLALALTGVVALSMPAPAMAAKPCWKQILDDWYDNEVIDSSYSASCYDEALDNMSQDLRDYSDLPGAITRARQRDLRGQPDDPGADRRVLAGPAVIEERSNGRSSNGPIDDLLNAAGPSSADSAPIPLLILAGLALLLIAAGAAGLLSRKVQARRARAAAPTSVRPPH